MPSPAILVLAPPDSLTTRLLHLLTSSPPFSGRPILTTTTTTTTANHPNIHPVPFDWSNTDTWTNLFTFPLSPATGREEEQPTTPSQGGRRETEIDAAYLAPPPAGGPASAALVEDFVDFARGKGVRRFVLLSSEGEGEGRGMGEVQGYLRRLGELGKVEWAVLSARWVQQNFIDQPVQIQGIRDESKIYSATGDGRVAWVSADDVAAVAVRALTNRRPPNTVYTIVGPELLSYDQIAAILTEILGRHVVHVALPSADLARRHREHNVPAAYAAALAAMDTSVKLGTGEGTNDVVLAVTGSAPKPFSAFARSVRDLWEKPEDRRLEAAAWGV